MADRLRVPRADNPLSRLETVESVMAKADLKNLEGLRHDIGLAVQRCFALAGVSQKEAAALVDRDQAQIARWIAGTERAQVDVLFAVERFRQPLVQALAEMAGSHVDVSTVITIRRAI